MGMQSQEHEIRIVKDLGTFCSAVDAESLEGVDDTSLDPLADKKTKPTQERNCRKQDIP